MTAILHSTAAPKIQSRALPPTATPHNFFDPILPIWRAWCESVQIEAEAGREHRQGDHYHQAWTARIRALELLVSFPGSSATALAARLHAGFHHAYCDALEIEKRDPAYRAQAAALIALLPALPDEMASAIERCLDGGC